MKIEVDIKIEITREEISVIKGVLPAFGKFFLATRQFDEYYTSPHRDFFAQNTLPNEWLRVRQNEGKKSIFAYSKSFSNENKADFYSEGYEIEVSDADELKKILSFLDFKKILEIDKKREYWDCGNVEIAIDEVKNLGFFVDIEASGIFESTKEAREACISFLGKLNIENLQERIIEKSYPALFLEKNK